MKAKQIIFTKPNTAELLPCDITPPKPDQVQVALDISTVSSGTERANISGDINVSTLKKERSAVFPRQSGYSSAGRVLAVTVGGRLKLKDMIGETHSPAKAPEVYTRLVTEAGFPVVQFDWRLLK